MYVCLKHMLCRKETNQFRPRRTANLWLYLKLLWHPDIIQIILLKNWHISNECHWTQVLRCLVLVSLVMTWHWTGNWGPLSLVLVSLMIMTRHWTGKVNNDDQTLHWPGKVTKAKSGRVQAVAQTVIGRQRVLRKKVQESKEKQTVIGRQRVSRNKVVASFCIYYLLMARPHFLSS